MNRPYAVLLCAAVLFGSIPARADDAGLPNFFCEIHFELRLIFFVRCAISICFRRRCDDDIQYRNSQPHRRNTAKA